MRILLVRHAPSAVQGICYGQSDIQCQLEATAAADQIARQLLDDRPDEIWASPWVRTRRPAEVLAACFGVSLRIDARLSELAMGSFEGRPYAELENDPAFAAWMQNWRTSAPPGGETLAQLAARVRDFREEQRQRRGTLLAVTHAGVIRALRAIERGVSPDEGVTDPVAHLVPELLAQ